MKTIAFLYFALGLILPITLMAEQYSFRFESNKLELIDKSKTPVLEIGRLYIKYKARTNYAIPSTAKRIDDSKLEISYHLEGTGTKELKKCTLSCINVDGGFNLKFLLEPKSEKKPADNLMLELIPHNGTVKKRPKKYAFQELYDDTSIITHGKIINAAALEMKTGFQLMIPQYGNRYWSTKTAEHLPLIRLVDGSYQSILEFRKYRPHKTSREALVRSNAYSLEISPDMKGSKNLFPVGVLGESFDGFLPYIGANYKVISYNPKEKFSLDDRCVTGLSIWAALRSRYNRNVKYAYNENKKKLGVNLFDPTTKKIIFDYARNGVKWALESSKDKIFKWEIDNEYIPALDYSHEAVAAFHKWLAKAYSGNLSKLNRAWKTSYKSFNDAIPAKLSEYADKPAAFMDWSRFQQETFAEFLGEYYSVIYNADPLHRGVNGKDTQSSLEMARIARTKRSNHELIGKAIAPYCHGVRGMDHYGHGDRNAYEINYFYNTIVPTGHKPGSRSGILYGENNNHNGPGWQFAQTIWRMIPNGLRGGDFFCNGWFGCWGDWAAFGFTRPDGTRRDKFYYLPRFYAMVHRAEKFFTQSAIPSGSKKLAILFAQRDIPFGADNNISPWSFPINSRLRVYSRLRDAGYWVQVITYDKLNAQYMKDVDGLFLVGAEHLSVQEIETVRNYVKNGGRLFADTRAGAFDEHHLLHPKGLSDVLGLKLRGLFAADNPVVDPGDVWFSSRYGNLVRGDGRVNFELTTAKIVNPYHAFSVSNKAAVLTCNKYGKGEAFWVNTQFGTIRSESSTGEQPVIEWYRYLLKLAGIKSSYTMAPDITEEARVEMPLIDAENNCFLTVCGMTFRALPPMKLDVRLPLSCDFDSAFYGFADDNELHKLKFNRKSNGIVEFELPAIRSAVALYLFKKHPPLLGLRFKTIKNSAKEDAGTPEFRPGESFKVIVQVANPNKVALNPGKLKFRVLNDWTVSPAQDTKTLKPGDIAEYEFTVKIPANSNHFIPHFIYPLVADFYQHDKRIAVTHSVVSIDVDLHGHELLLSDNWSQSNYPWAIWTGADYTYLSVPNKEKKEFIKDKLHTILGDNTKVYALQSGDRPDRLRSAEYHLPEAVVQFDLKKCFDLTRIYVRRGRGALNSPQKITVAFSTDGISYSKPLPMPLDWKADYGQLRLLHNIPARFIKIVFYQEIGKSSLIDGVWIYGKLRQNRKNKLSGRN